MPTDDQPIPSVWTRPRKGREQPALSRERIVAEAVRLLDAEGIDALSMRTLGTRLGAGATSLYRHVTSKDELIELALDEVLAELEVPAPADPSRWREALAAAARGLRAMVLRHPWFAAVVSQAGLAYLGPNMMRLSDRLLGVFETAGFDLVEAERGMTTLIAYVMGITAGETAWLTMLARTGQDERELIQRLWPAAERAAEGHPRLRALYAAQRGADPARGREESFDYGLQRLLDGLASRLATPGPAS
jgi:AcrR family transcriptional regulator